MPSNPSNSGRGPSLLIPCFNAARFLPRLMESVRAQTMPFGEICCYDDGSTDETRAMARSFGLRVLGGGSNRGVAHARNRLVEAAEGEWIHFHDADDLIAPTFLERLTPWCTADYEVVSCDADWLDEKTRELIISWRYDPVALASAPHIHLLRNAMGLNNTIIRKSAWERIGGCNESLTMWEDADAHIRLARSGARFHHVPEVLTWSLRRDESFSHDYRQSWLRRVHALEDYASAPEAAAVRPALAAEAEQAAGKLAQFGDRPGATRAIALCRRLGGSPPSSRNPLLRLLKPVLPAFTLLCLQQRWRKRTAESGRPY